MVIIGDGWTIIIIIIIINIINNTRDCGKEKCNHETTTAQTV